MEGEFEAVSAEFREFSTKMKDPLVVGALLHKLTEERQATNLLLREINAKLERIEALENRFRKIEQGEQVLLPEVDQEIIAFVKNQGAVCAEDVQEKFNYKGKNAASARLNKLCVLGTLRKTQVGKKVFFQLNGSVQPTQNTLP